MMVLTLFTIVSHRKNALLFQRVFFRLLKNTLFHIRAFLLLPHKILLVLRPALAFCGAPNCPRLRLTNESLPSFLLQHTFIFFSSPKNPLRFTFFGVPPSSKATPPNMFLIDITFFSMCSFFALPPENTARPSSCVRIF